MSTDAPQTAPAAHPARQSRPASRLRWWAALAGVVAAALAASAIVLDGYQQDARLSIGTVRFAVDPGPDRSLDLYVPVLDWGVRYEGVRFPARLHVDVRAIDRTTASRVARGANPDVAKVLTETRDAARSYLRNLIVILVFSGTAGGALVAAAMRGRRTPRLRVAIPAAAATALATGVAVAVLLPPSGPLDRPIYFANGPDIPAALEAIQTARSASSGIGEEIEAQVVALGRLATGASERRSAAPQLRAVVASDLHDNLLALPALERATGDAPLFVVGDVSSAGTPIESTLVSEVARIGSPVVAVTGNHDSPDLARALARAGAIVLTENGRLLPDDRYGPVVVQVAGLRVAGYSDPFERRREDGYRQREEPRPTVEQKERFREWVDGLAGRVDVILVHNPNVAEFALEALREDPPAAPLVILTGDTHEQKLTVTGTLIELNGGTVGAGGTGNFTEGEPLGLAILGYETAPRFRPRTADLVRIDVGSGSARAERTVLNPPDPD